MKQKRYLAYARSTNIAMSIASTMIASIFIFFFIGKWLDSKLGTTPSCMIGGIFLGTVIGLYSLYKELVLLVKEDPGNKGEENDLGDKND